MALTFIRRDPHKGYFGRQLWLPKAHINCKSVKAGLEFPILGDAGIEFLQLWEDAGDHLIVPREFIPRSEYQTLPFQIVSSQPSAYPRVGFKTKIELDAKWPTKTTQRDAYRDMRAAGGGLLNLACGKGKSVLALHYIAHAGVPALIIVNNTTLIDQWRNYVEQFLEVEGGVGVIQGPPREWDWEGRGIVLAMIHSLALHGQQMPVGMDRYFGIVIYDEVHHLSAPLFSATAPMFYGERHGLTATVNREDGLEPIYQYHIGQVYHRNLEQELIPRIYFQLCPVTVDWKDPVVVEAIYDVNGKLSIPKLRTFLGTYDPNNDFIATKLEKPRAAGRKILVLSHSVDQLRHLHQRFPGSGICTGTEKPAARIEALRTSQFTFGTLQLVKEALDEASLDTLYFLTPFGSTSIEEGGFNTLQQGMGRIQRAKEGKKMPVVVILDHLYVPKFHRMCNQLRKQLRNWPADQGGPLVFSNVRPYSEETSGEETTDRP